MSISQDDFISAIKKTSPDSVIRWAKETRQDESAFCETNGSGTSSIARHLNITMAEARKQLDKLAKQGVIFKSKDNAGSVCRWWPKGYLSELQLPKRKMSRTPLL